MIRLLAKWFIRKEDHESPERLRTAYGVLSGCFGIFLNLVLFTIKLIFGLLAKVGKIEEHMMYNTYNMGIGMVLAVAPEDAETVQRAVADAGWTSWQIGEVTAGETGVDVI